MGPTASGVDQSNARRCSSGRIRALIRREWEYNYGARCVVVERIVANKKVALSALGQNGYENRR